MVDVNPHRTPKREKEAFGPPSASRAESENDMKKTTLILTMIMAMIHAAQAANVASDSAADGAYDAGWTDGSNGGTGFAAWQLTAHDGGGHFMGTSSGNAGGTSGSIDTNGPSWGLWSTNGTVDAVRPLTGGDLMTEQALTVEFDNGYLNSTRSAYDHRVDLATVSRYR